MVKEEIKSYDMLWGGFFGLLIGLIIAKVYQTWSISFIEYGRRLMASDIGWSSKPLWILSTEYPSMFTFITSLLFMVIGIVYVTYLKKRRLLLNSEKQNEQLKVEEADLNEGNQNQ